MHENKYSVKNYQFRLDIPLADCYNIKVLKTEAEMLR